MELNEIITIIITTVIIPLLTWGVKTLTNLADAKIEQIKNKTVRDAFAEARIELEEAVFTAVSETQQTFVEALKVDGQFTADDAKEAFDKSFQRAKEIMSNSGMEIIETATGALDALITAQIEKAIKELK
ncbi:MAG: hypothetical protein PHX50_17125 [Massilibacteroides sp.]|nr:hypothetical protein [Massilibacteroides sp.]